MSITVMLFLSIWLRAAYSQDLKPVIEADSAKENVYTIQNYLSTSSVAIVTRNRDRIYKAMPVGDGTGSYSTTNYNLYLLDANGTRQNDNSDYWPIELRSRMLFSEVSSPMQHIALTTGQTMIEIGERSMEVIQKPKYPPAWKIYRSAKNGGYVIVNAKKTIAGVIVVSDKEISIKLRSHQPPTATDELYFSVMLMMMVYKKFPDLSKQVEPKKAHSPATTAPLGGKSPNTFEAPTVLQAN